MRDGGRIGAAIEILEEVETRRRPVADALRDWGLSHRFAGSGDRIAIANLVFDVLRRRASLAHRVGSEDARLLAFAAYALLWGHGLDGLRLALAGDRHAPPAPSEAEAARLAAPGLEEAPGWIAGDVPQWLWPQFERAFGADAAQEGAALATRAPIDLRVNTLKATRERVLCALSRLGAAPTPYSPLGVRVAVGSGWERPPHVQGEGAYHRGFYEVQDEGSQLSALVAAADGPGQVVDLCAGAGGKTLAMAARMENRGQIYAYDSDARRFGDIRERIRRAGVRNVQIRYPGPADPLADLAGRADLVLVDAPCTGTGTWRRRPDAKWRLAPGAIEARKAEQDTVLSGAARLVRPGGRIAYVTCSVLPDENEERVAAFLSAHGDHALADPEPHWRAVTGTALAPAHTVAIPPYGRAVRLTPRTAGTDGFFIALIERKAP